MFGIEVNYNYFKNTKSSSASSIAFGIVNPPGTVLQQMTGAAALEIKDVVTSAAEPAGPPAIFCPTCSAASGSAAWMSPVR